MPDQCPKCPYCNSELSGDLYVPDVIHSRPAARNVWKCGTIHSTTYGWVRSAKCFGGIVSRLQSELAAQSEKIERLTALLRKVEFVKDDASGLLYCPICAGSPADHAFDSDCPLWAEIKP